MTASRADRNGILGENWNAPSPVVLTNEGGRIVAIPCKIQSLSKIGFLLLELGSCQDDTRGYEDANGAHDVAA